MDKKHILVVDDSPTVLKLAQDLLAVDCFVVETCKNGEEAKTLIQQKEFDLIISDEEMPLVNGSELVEWFRTSFANTTTPFVIMSSKNDSPLFAKLLSKKFINAMFPKPFQYPAFVSIVYGLLGIQDISVLKKSQVKN